MSDKADYFTALNQTNLFIDDLMTAEIQAGAAYSGILTAVLFRLLKSNAEKHDVTGLIGAAMASASAHVEMGDGNLSDIH
jgi:hypothetical protein